VIAKPVRNLGNISLRVNATMEQRQRKQQCRI